MSIIECKNRGEYLVPAISISAGDSSEKKHMRQVVSYYKSMLLKWRPRIDPLSSAVHFNDLGSVGKSPAGSEKVQKVLRDKARGNLGNCSGIPLCQFAGRNFRTILTNLNRTVLSEKDESDKKRSINDLLSSILSKQKPLKIYDKLNLTQYKKFIGGGRFLPELGPPKKEPQHSKVQHQKKLIQSARKKSLENITRMFWSQINPDKYTRRSKPTTSVTTISKYIENFRLLANVNSNTPVSQTEKVSRQHNARAKKLVATKKLLSDGNLSMVLPMYSALIPVSYTHLTLPTNREV
eukprot:TRINITY_DN1475_c0_g3_i1.p1 TRINITY_DN1475_c0_g3~~TRINITY_DN1475_c0_g3_i1.p1  ORF type:complete len:294 (-),score=20.31 TRINITY_DN1475_c0_g3_i1:19-900(-)